MRRVFLTLLPAMAFPWHYTAASWPPANWPGRGQEWEWIQIWLPALIAGVWAAPCAVVIWLPDCFARLSAPHAAFNLQPRPLSPGSERGYSRRPAGAPRHESRAAFSENQCGKF